MGSAAVNFSYAEALESAKTAGPETPRCVKTSGPVREKISFPSNENSRNPIFSKDTPATPLAHFSAT
jgi:hypothetical protein